MNKELVRKGIEDFIKGHGYTYTVEAILESYNKYYKNGYYVSHTMQICIRHLSEELELLNE